VWWPLDASAVRGILAPTGCADPAPDAAAAGVLAAGLERGSLGRSSGHCPHRATNHTGKPRSDRALERANRIRKRLDDDVFSALGSMSSRPSRCACAG
jgi:hypothetical protein